ncbi:NAD(P)(+) transhydrogenase (Re/Si-specific) subunit beta [Niastella vici]|uniref:NAD(P)(+) transhydrogenase (Re/Si-specific) subunit beta n=1 Tax=Niastella vici TaxID=1703345 RepID=UPI00117F517E|nr:NAD(P)(+) transhydrogenase (Re/Si-specific) subunit beta [Niastella vici]
MPQSRHRHKQHRHHPHEPARKPQSVKTARRNPVTIMVIFAGILGIIAALIAAGPDPVWLVTGVLAGAVIGYIIGKRMSRLS